MTYTTLQQSIIREFGRKPSNIQDASFGCILSIEWDCEEERIIWKLVHILSDSDEWCSFFSGVKIVTDYASEDIEYSEDEIEILWHIPHLEDVFRVAAEKWLSFYIDSERNAQIWIDWKSFRYIPSIPLLDQDESTLTQLLTLFKKWETHT